MWRNACAIAAFVACLVLTNDAVDAQGGKKQFGGKKAPGAVPSEVKQDADGRTKPGPTYMPLNVGNRWEYSVATNNKTATLVSRIARVETATGVGLAVLETEVDGKLSAVEYLREIDLGIFRVRSGQLAPTPSLLVLRSPARGGDKWNAAFVIGKTKGTYAVETTEEDVDVPAGKFKTIQAKFTVKLGAAKPSVTTTWYAENVGIVKKTEGDSVALLEKYEVNSAPAAGAVAGGVGDAKPKSPPTYFPFEIGNQWEYDLTLNGNVASYVERLARTETVDGVALVVLESELNGKVIATEHLRQAGNGVFLHRKAALDVTPPVLMLKNPLKAGDKWSGTALIGPDKTTFTAETGEEDVAVPAGRFKTIRVKHTIVEKGKTMVSTWWCALNVGNVKQTVEAEGMSFVAELRKFDLKKAAN